MRPSIEERMNRQIEKAGIYNGMFDAGVTADPDVAVSTAVTPASIIRLLLVHSVSLI